MTVLSNKSLWLMILLTGGSSHLEIHLGVLDSLHPWCSHQEHCFWKVAISLLLLLSKLIAWPMEALWLSDVIFLFWSKSTHIQWLTKGMVPKSFTCQWKWYIQEHDKLGLSSIWALHVKMASTPLGETLPTAMPNWSNSTGSTEPLTHSNVLNAWDQLFCLAESCWSTGLLWLFNFSAGDTN